MQVESSLSDYAMMYINVFQPTLAENFAEVAQRVRQDGQSPYALPPLVCVSIRQAKGGIIVDEYVRVTFATRRKVRVDGQPTGFTNKVFQVETGHHTFDLGPKQNYSPNRHDVNVIGTIPSEPMVISFTRTEA